MLHTAHSHRQIRELIISLLTCPVMPVINAIFLFVLPLSPLPLSDAPFRELAITELKIRYKKK